MHGKTMSDLTDADLEAMEKRTWSDNLIREAVARGWCANENAHKEMDVTLGEAIAVEVQTLIREHFYKLPALIAALREARGERDGMSELYAREGHKSLVLLNENTSLLAENRLLRDLLARVVDGDDVISEAAVVLYSDDGKAIALTAAEVARVRRMEAESRAARAYRDEYRKDFGARKDLGDNLHNLFQLLDEHDEAAALGEGES